jgi:hypothetical protein
VVQSVVQDGAEKEANQLTQALHHYQVQNNLLLSENKGLRESLATKKKRNKHGKKLDLQGDGSDHGGAVWSSPRSFKRAYERQAQREQAQEEEKLRKVNMKELKASNALLNKKLQEEKKAQEQAKKKQQKEKEHQAAEARKIAQSSQIAPATTSKKQAPKRKRVERCTASASSGQGGELSQAPPPKVTRTGRSITIPKKFR